MSSTKSSSASGGTLVPSPDVCVVQWAHHLLKKARFNILGWQPPDYMYVTRTATTEPYTSVHKDQGLQRVSGFPHGGSKTVQQLFMVANIGSPAAPYVSTI